MIIDEGLIYIFTIVYFSFFHSVQCGSVALLFAFFVRVYQIYSSFQNISILEPPAIVDPPSIPETTDMVIINDQPETPTVSPERVL